MAKPVKVLMTCTGVGIFNRGIETFFSDAFRGLHPLEGVQLLLVKGAGRPRDDERVALCLPRTSWLATWLGRCVGRNGYVVEQWSSAPSIVRLIARFRPHVIFYSDANLGFILHWLKRRFRLNYTLLYSNGGPVMAPYRRVDMVHQVSPAYLQQALAAGENPATQFLVPYGFSISNNPPGRSPAAQRAARAALGLPLDRKILLSVGWISRQHKRMDYLVSELSKVPKPRPFLVMLGNMDSGSEDVIRLANDCLGPTNFTARSVAPELVDQYYRAADAFVLASLREGFGRVYVEALASGLPVIAHNFPVARDILGEFGFFGDFQQAGALSEILSEVQYLRANEESERARWAFARQRFSWEALRPAYRDMFLAAAARS